MKLFHFTSLFHLAPISREGIKMGEVPVDMVTPYDKTPKGVNLTINGDPATNRKIWCNGKLNKVAMRLTVNLPDAEVLDFRTFRKRFKVNGKDVVRLCPYEEREHWFYYFQPIPTSAIVSWELLDGDQYRALSDDELLELVKKIDAERERALIVDTVPTGRLKGAGRLALRSGVESSFLLD